MCYNSSSCGFIPCSSSVVEKPPQLPKSAKTKKSFWRRRKPKTHEKSEGHQDVLKPGECLTSSAEEQAPVMPKNKRVNTTPAADNSRTKPSSISADKETKASPSAVTNSKKPHSPLADKQAKASTSAVTNSTKPSSISADKETKALPSAVTNSTKPPSPSAVKPAWKFLSAIEMNTTTHCPGAVKPVNTALSPSSIRGETKHNLHFPLYECLYLCKTELS